MTAHNINQIKLALDRGRERTLSLAELEAYLMHVTEGQYRIATTRPERTDAEEAPYYWQIYDQPWYGAKNRYEALTEAIYHAGGI